MCTWIKSKFRQLLELLGIAIPHDWLLLKAIEKEYGKDAAASCLVTSLFIELDCDCFLNTKKNHQKICEYTKNEMD